MSSGETLDELRNAVERFENLAVSKFSPLVGSWEGELGLEKWGNRIRLIYGPAGEEAKPWSDCSVKLKLKITPEALSSFWEYLKDKDSLMSVAVTAKIKSINELVNSLENTL